VETLGVSVDGAVFHDTVDAACYLFSNNRLFY